MHLEASGKNTIFLKREFIEEANHVLKLPNAKISAFYSTLDTGMIHSALGNEVAAIDDFHKGAYELYRDANRLPEKNKTFSEKCVEELQKSELIS